MTIIHWMLNRLTTRHRRVRSEALANLNR